MRPLIIIFDGTSHWIGTKEDLEEGYEQINGMEPTPANVEFLNQAYC